MNIKDKTVLVTGANRGIGRLGVGTEFLVREQRHQEERAAALIDS
jgi:NAD(P)-dependent dehydrogenase (short-subunit alcohol dehydrogenase family)